MKFLKLSKLFGIMAAKDYEIEAGLINAYLTKKKNKVGKGLQSMSEDRRVITDNEILGLFEFYLRKWCDEHEGEDSLVVTDSDGKKIFLAKLLDKEKSV